MCTYTEELAKVWIDLYHAGTGVLNPLHYGSGSRFLGVLNGSGERILFLKLCLLKIF
jgi:hypothetical protein